MSDDQAAFAGEELTEAETNYIQSGGEATEGLAEPTQEQTPAKTEEAPEAKASEPAPKEGQGEQPKHVPITALHEERTRRQALEADLKAQREAFARGDERLSALIEAISGGKKADPAAAEAPIDPEQDIFGAFKQLKAQNDALMQRLQTGEKRQDEASAKQQIISTYQQSATRLAQEKPDLGDAYNFLISSRAKEYQAMGIEDAEAIHARIRDEEAQLVTQAIQNKRDPAKAIYDFAVARGYAPRQAAPKNNEQNTNAAQSDALKQLEQIEKGKAASIGLSGAGGASDGGLTMEKLAAMDEGEFEKAFSKLTRAQQARLFGG